MIDLTAVVGGPYRVFVNGVEQPGTHNTEREAIQRATEELLKSWLSDDPEVATVEYSHDYRVKMSVSTLGLVGLRGRVFTPAIPSPVTDLAAAAATADQINLSWSDPNGGVTKFAIYRALVSGVAQSPTALIFTTDAGATSYSDVGLAAATAYFYMVIAINTTTHVESLPSNEATATTAAAPGQAPAAASGCAATPIGPNRIDVGWTDNSNNENGFKVQRAPNVAGAPGTWVTIFTAPAGAVAYSDQTVAEQTKYWYRIIATNPFGDAAPSNSDDATTPAVPPPATGSWVDSLATGDFSHTQNGVQWTGNFSVGPQVVTNFGRSDNRSVRYGYPQKKGDPVPTSNVTSTQERRISFPPTRKLAYTRYIWVPTNAYFRGQSKQTRNGLASSTNALTWSGVETLYDPDPYLVRCNAAQCLPNHKGLGVQIPGAGISGGLLYGLIEQVISDRIVRLRATSSDGMGDVVGAQTAVSGATMSQSLTTFSHDFKWFALWGAGNNGYDDPENRPIIVFEMNPRRIATNEQPESVIPFGDAWLRIMRDKNGNSTTSQIAALYHGVRNAGTGDGIGMIRGQWNEFSVFADVGTQVGEGRLAIQINGTKVYDQSNLSLYPIHVTPSVHGHNPLWSTLYNHGFINVPFLEPTEFFNDDHSISFTEPAWL